MSEYTPVVPDEGELGPAMRALRPRQRAFVQAMLDLGAGPGKYGLCARLAGYAANTPESLHACGSRLAHDEHVQAALIEEGKKRMGGAVVVATSVLVKMIEDDLVSTKDKQRAIEMIFNRVGLPNVTEQKITVAHTLSDADMIKRIKQLAGTLGMDSTLLLGRAGEDVIEGEFVELPAPAPTGAEGLEDLL